MVYMRIRLDEASDLGLLRLGELLQQHYQGLFAHQKDPADTVHGLHEFHLTLAGGLHSKHPAVLARVMVQVAEASENLPVQLSGVKFCSFMVSKQRAVSLVVESAGLQVLANVACRALAPCNDFFLNHPHITLGVYSGNASSSKAFEAELNGKFQTYLASHARMRAVEMCEDGQLTQPVKLGLWRTKLPAAAAERDDLAVAADRCNASLVLSASSAVLDTLADQATAPASAPSNSNLHQAAAPAQAPLDLHALWAEAYDCAKQSGSLHPAIFDLHAHVVRGALPREAFLAWINTQAPRSGYSLLHQLAWHLSGDTLGQELVRLGADAALCNSRGETAGETQDRRRAELAE